ncbi:MAG TPA: hypothetical protein VIW64_06115 [Pyrinomonadaceae bacterium]|jgi:hypothetical protein
MAIIVKTSSASELLKAIRKAIENKKIETWSYDSDGDFTHTPDQWNKKAWLRPKVYIGELRFGILAPQDTKMSTYIYGVYHGRFIEMLLSHFDSDFTTANATAQKTEPDIF